MPASSHKLHVRFFAILREQAGCSMHETDSAAANASQLYAELQRRFPGLVFPVNLLRVSVNERYVPLDAPLAPGDRVVFIPPVAGG
jgi:molybdopterin converting factor small subunit